MSCLLIFSFNLIFKILKILNIYMYIYISIKYILFNTTPHFKNVCTKFMNLWEIAKLWTFLYIYVDSWITIDQLDVTCFIISPFTIQHVSNVSTSIFMSLRLTVDLFHYIYFLTDQYNTLNKSTISHKLPKMDVLIFETCWAVNGEIIKRVTSSWSIFIQLSRWCTVQQH